MSNFGGPATKSATRPCTPAVRWRILTSAIGNRYNRIPPCLLNAHLTRSLAVLASFHVLRRVDQRTKVNKLLATTEKQLRIWIQDERTAACAPGNIHRCRPQTTTTSNTLLLQRLYNCTLLPWQRLVTVSIMTGSLESFELISSWPGKSRVERCHPVTVTVLSGIVRHVKCATIIRGPSGVVSLSKGKIMKKLWW